MEGIDGVRPWNVVLILSGLIVLLVVVFLPRLAQFELVSLWSPSDAATENAVVLQSDAGTMVFLSGRTDPSTFFRLSGLSLGSSAASVDELFSSFLATFSLTRFNHSQTRKLSWGNCQDISTNLTLPKQPRVIAHGTVKDIYVGKWDGMPRRVAVLRLRKEELNGDFSSGASRLRALQGHPNIISLVALCPIWEGYTAAGSEQYLEAKERATAEGHSAHFNTIVTPFQENGDLDGIEAVLNGGRYPNNWQQRLRIAIDYARVLAFLHNSELERNPFSKPLVQKDRKISQFLLGDDLTLLLNDVEAMPFSSSDEDLREDVCYMPTVFRKIFGDANLPTGLNRTLGEIYRSCEPAGSPLSSLSILHMLLLSFEVS